MTRSAVDVIIPTVGRPSLLRAVDSVLAQCDYTRAVVALDAPDRAERVREMLPTGSRVLIVETDGGCGGAVARNRGVAASTAATVAFLDDDDWWAPDSLERRLATVSGRSPFFIAGAFVHEKGDDNLVVPRERPPRGSISDIASYLVSRRDLTFGRSALQSSTMIVSSDVARAFPWASSLRKHQDWDFALRVLASPDIEFGWFDEPTVHVEKDSSASVSRRLSAADSLAFLRAHPEIRGRARADFLAVHVLRAALSRRSMSDLRQYAASGPWFPHAAALVVGMSGAMRPRRRVQG